MELKMVIKGVIQVKSLFDLYGESGPVCQRAEGGVQAKHLGDIGL